jgi:hypothetical protein
MTREGAIFIATVGEAAVGVVAGFAATGQSRPFPGHPGRSISEMRLDLAGISQRF